MNILTDSNYFYALLNPFDSLHEKAIYLSQKIKEDNATLFVNEYIILETLTIISQRINKQLAIDLGNSFLKEDGVSLIYVNEKIFQNTWKIFKQNINKDMSFADCSLIATIQDRPIDALLTFDLTDFKQLQIPYHFNLYYKG